MKSIIIRKNEMNHLDLGEKYLFCSEMKTILSSGMNMEEGLHLIKDNLSGRLSEVSATLLESMEKGAGFEDAAMNCGAFDDYFVQMIKIGQINGCSDQVMGELASYYEKEKELESAVRESISYPFVLMLLMLLITGILHFVVIPIFEDVLKKIGISSFSSASGMMKAGKLISGFCFGLLLIVVVSVLVYYAYIKISGNSEISAKILMKIPVSKKVYESVMTARITYALSLFVHSGYPLEEAAEHLPSLIKEDGMRKKTSLLVGNLKEGKPFAEAAGISGIYSGLPLSMLNIGLKSGRQEEALEQLCGIYEKESSEKMSRFLSTIEPSMIVCLSVIVGIILLSVMLPLMSVLTMMG